MQPQHQHIYQVSELSFEVRELLEANYPNIWVEGEISNLSKPTSGHIYFSIKDKKSQIRCAFFRNHMSRLNFIPENGIQVKIRAKISLYENRGDFQLIVSQLEEAGLGDLQAKFEKLKAKLANEGLFSSDNKKPLPPFPKTIGVITSSTGAAIKDIISTCERRYPSAKILVYPVQVQGMQAAAEIAAAVKQADSDQFCDVIIVGRGGGSLEDLWAFNEEILVRAIHDCSIPIISAVGHEIDFSIADFVADVRAPTPTAAAELATPESQLLIGQLAQIQKRMLALIKHTLINKIQHTDMLTGRLVHPKAKLASWQQLGRQLSERLHTHVKHLFQQNRQHINNLERLLLIHSSRTKIDQSTLRVHELKQQLVKLSVHSIELKKSKILSIQEKLIAISPQSTLERGYTIARESTSQKILRSAKTLDPDTHIELQFFDGVVGATTD